MELSSGTMTIIVFVLSSVTSGLIGFLIFLFQRTSKNERDLWLYKLEAAEKFAHKEEISVFAIRLETKIEELFKKVYETKKQE
ncbi:hypothetical protein A8139_05525 [Marinomonas primoryensis]|uniref:Uncharacterized protein n=1 Tax=Marinomonas primoryensis TaxID=178399 RepID=A0A2Z4PPF7_9GAMM|nr:hypothetical protein [Marinomonas primoryensis]AWX99510.1 hypothetical protein A8139_05525 [Marinomonas primoryensis]